METNGREANGGTNGHHANGRSNLSSTNESDEIGDNLGQNLDPENDDIFEPAEEILAQENHEIDKFDEIIGCIEDIVIDQPFQELQESFLEKHYHNFDIDTEENKLIYTEIFQVRKRVAF